MKKPNYDAQDIQVLEGLEPVRERPGMYIGSTGPRGLHHLVYEVVDNSVDEALAGYCSAITVTIHPDNSITVADNGRGIPVGIMAKYDKPAAAIVLTMLHAGGKFGGEGYKVSGGLHGVGVSVVNALCEWLELDIYVDGYHWHQRFERGDPVTELVKKEKLDKDGPTGTTISFLADPDIFEEVDFDYRVLAQRLRETAFLTKELQISLNDERADGESVTFQYEGGIQDFVAYINREKDAIHRSIIFLENETDDGAVEVAMQWNSSYNESIFTFANNINTTEGGATSPASGPRSRAPSTTTPARRACSRRKTTTSPARTCARASQRSSRSSSRTRSSRARPRPSSATPRSAPWSRPRSTPSWPSSSKRTRPRRGSRRQGDQRGAGAQRRAQGARPHAPQGPARGLHAARQARRLLDQGPGAQELYLVEGDSAGGSAKQARDRSFQAILPLRGKIINVEKARIDKMLANNEILTMISAMGTGIGDEFDIEQARYHKIIIMTDADVDGSHIRTLILTFLFRHMTPLVDAGYVYIAQPPLYRLKQGNQETYIHKESQLEEILLRGRLEQIHVDNTNTGFTFSETKYQRFLKLFGEYEGWVKKLKCQWGGEIIDWLKNGPLIEAEIADFRGAPSGAARGHRRALRHRRPRRRRRGAGRRHAPRRAAHRSGRQPAHPLRALSGREFQSLKRVHERVNELVGTPPFTLHLGQRKAEAASYEELRVQIVDLVKEGMQLQRFKGLGEMNPDQLWETTMNPMTRTLSSCAWKTPRPPTKSSRCSWATRSSRGASSSRRTPKRCASSTSESLQTLEGKIEPIELEDEMRSSFIDYAMSVITDRALPDVRDGLKPSQRRVLVAMNDLGLAPNKQHRKCAKIAGDTSGNYHPHGEAVIYPTLVRMAQDFNMRYTLVDGQGNFGSVEGDSPAAMRYTEARFSKIAVEMLRDIDANTVDWMPNYDETRREPTRAAQPHAQPPGQRRGGIAVGMATNLPPHNLGEVVDAIVHVIDDPEASADDLMQFI